MTQIEAISHWLWSAIIKCNKNWTNTIDINRGEKEVEKKKYIKKRESKNNRQSFLPENQRRKQLEIEKNPKSDCRCKLIRHRESSLSIKYLYKRTTSSCGKIANNDINIQNVKDQDEHDAEGETR